MLARRGVEPDVTPGAKELTSVLAVHVPKVAPGPDAVRLRVEYEYGRGEARADQPVCSPVARRARPRPALEARPGEAWALLFSYFPSISRRGRRTAESARRRRAA